MLGDFSICINDTNVVEANTRINKNWELFIMLILRANENITNEQMMEELWYEEDIENPVGALKNAIYNLRKFLNKVDPETSFIIMEGGRYKLNPAVDIYVDVWEFEKVAKIFLDSKNEKTGQAEFGMEVLRLYGGELLPSISDRQWLFRYAGYLRGLYLDVSKKMCEILLKSNKRMDWQDALNISNRAVLLEPLNEEMYTVYFMAMKKLNMKRAIIGYYPILSDLFYDELGERVSDEIREIYIWATEGTNKEKEDLNHIQQELMEVTRDERPIRGAYYCQYEIFKSMYQMMARTSERPGHSINIMMITLMNDKGEIPPKAKVVDEMTKLKSLLKDLLRKGDIYSRYSRNQYIIMLPVKCSENCSMIMERIRNGYQNANTAKDMVISIEAQELISIT